MSMDDDLDPRNPARRKGFETARVEALSIDELKAYIEHAKQEIARAEAEIHNRESLRGEADALFRR